MAVSTGPMSWLKNSIAENPTKQAYCIPLESRGEQKVSSCACYLDDAVSVASLIMHFMCWMQQEGF